MSNLVEICLIEVGSVSTIMPSTFIVVCVPDDDDDVLDLASLSNHYAEYHKNVAVIN